MKVSDLRAQLERMKDSDDVVIPVKTLGVAIGGQPYVEVKSMAGGFDWDHGRAFVMPASAVHIAGEEYRREQEHSRDRGEALGFIWMAITNSNLDATQKVDAVRRTMKRFGFGGKSE